MLTKDTVFRQGVEWIARNAYRLDMTSDEIMYSNPVQMLAYLADVAPEWIVQCVDRCARNKQY